MNTNTLLYAREYANTNKKGSAIAKANYVKYMQSYDIRLSDVYTRYSRAKEYAFEYCKTLRDDLEGDAVAIIGHNSQAFTCGFTFRDPETADQMFCYITKDYVRYCYI